MKNFIKDCNLTPITVAQAKNLALAIVDGQIEGFVKIVEFQRYEPLYAGDGIELRRVFYVDIFKAREFM